MENNNQDLKLCPVCGAKNKSIYQYCNECGAALVSQSYTGSGAASAPVYNSQANSQPVAPSYIPEQYVNAPQTEAPQNTEQNNPPYSQYQQPQYNAQSQYTPPQNNYQQNNNPFFNFNGVSEQEMFDYTGRKTGFYNKIKEQHLNGSNPFCWPLLVLGLIFGFFGMGCWYLYHKLYKPALLFLGAAVVQLVVGVLIIYTVFVPVMNSLGPILENANDSYALETFAEEIIESIAFSVGLLGLVSNAFNIAGFVLAIVMPFSAYRTYKNTAISKITALKMQNPMASSADIGGTKGGTVALIAVAWGLIGVILFVSLFASIFSSIFKYALQYEYQDDMKPPIINDEYEDFFEDEYGKEFDFDFDY